MKLTQIERAMELLHRAETIIIAEVYLKHDVDKKLEDTIKDFDRTLDTLDSVNEHNKGIVEKKSLVV